MVAVTSRDVTRQENAERTNVVVEERADLAWIHRAFKRSLPKAPASRSGSGAESAEPRDTANALTSSSSSSVESDDDDEETPQQLLALPPIMGDPQKSSRTMEDDYQQSKVAQKEWQSFEDRARELRRLVEEERDPDALRQLQHLKKPKQGRLKKSELPTIMLSNRYMRAEQTTQQQVDQSASNVAASIQDIAISREQAARRRRMHMLEATQSTPTSSSPQGLLPLPHEPPKPNRAVKLPSLTAPTIVRGGSSEHSHYSATTRAPPPSPAASGDQQDQQLSNGEPGLVGPQEASVNVACVAPPSEERHHGATIAAAGSTVPAADHHSPNMRLLSPSPDPSVGHASSHSSPDRRREAQDLTSSILSAVEEARENELSAVRESARRLRGELRHVDELERISRSDVVDYEGESRRELLREALMENTSIVRREREVLSAQREAAFRQELQHGEERRHFAQREARERDAILGASVRAMLQLDRCALELTYSQDVQDIEEFERTEWASLMEVLQSERRLCAKLAEERRVREEAERRIRLFAERRAREERERLYAEKMRSDVRDQMAVLALEISVRHVIERDENGGYVSLLQHGSSVHQLVSTLREELQRREAEERSRREKEELRQRLAQEHSARRDMQIEEDQLRTKLQIQTITEHADLVSVERQARHACMVKTNMRLMVLLVERERVERDSIGGEEDVLRIKLAAHERTMVLSVLEKVKLREAEESRRAFEEADRHLKEALHAKQLAADRLREETQRIEEDRITRKSKDAEMHAAAQLSLLANEEQLHRQLLNAAVSSEFETLQGRQEAAIEIVLTRSEAARERRMDAERSIERRRREDEADAKEREARWQREAEREEAQRLEQAKLDEESSAERNRKQPDDEAHQRYAALYLAQQLADEDARKKKEEDQREWLRRQEAWLVEATEGLGSTEQTERRDVASTERTAWDRVMYIASIHRRSAVDREQLRLLEQSDEGTYAGSVSPIRSKGPIGTVTSPSRRDLAESEFDARGAIAKEAAQAMMRIQDLFRSATAEAVKAMLDSERDLLASTNPEIASLVAAERERRSQHKRNACMAALYALTASEQEGRKMLVEAQRSTITRMEAHKDHDTILAKASENKRLSAIAEQTRLAEVDRARRQQMDEERMLIHAQQHLSLFKDEMMHRQVVELAEQADIDNTSSRALHGRVLIETKEAARLREQQRTIEQMAAVAARVEVFLSMVVADEHSKRTSMQSAEFSDRRLLAEWVAKHELTAKTEEARREAELIRREGLKVTSPPSAYTSDLERAIREREESLRRATAEALEKRPTSSASGETPTSTPSTTHGPAMPPVATSSSRKQDAWLRGEHSASFDEASIRGACFLMDVKAASLFVREEGFLRTALMVSEHAIRKDIHREERHLRRARGGNVSPLRDRTLRDLVAIQNDINAMIAKESYLRDALDAEEHQRLIGLLAFARTAGIIQLQKEVSPLRHILSVGNQQQTQRSGFGQNERAPLKWLRASMEVIFQEEYHRREQIIAEFNRVKLEQLMQPFERELELVSVSGEEVVARHSIESEEATVVTKLLKRLKRQVRLWEMLAANSQDARASVMREFQERIKLLSTAELMTLSPPRIATTVEQRAPVERLSPVPIVDAPMYPHEPVGGAASLENSGSSTPRSYGASNVQNAQTPATLRNKPANASPVYTVRGLTASELREAIVDLEIEQSQRRSIIAKDATATLSVVAQCGSVHVSVLRLYRAGIEELHETFDRRAAVIRGSMEDAVREEWDQAKQRLLNRDFIPRRAITDQQDAVRNMLYRFHELCCDRDNLCLKAKRTRAVLFESVELERTSASRLAQQRALHRSMGVLEHQEQQARQSLVADEVFEWKRVRREIVELVDLKAKVDLGLVDQKKRLLMDEEHVYRLQREWAFDLLIRLTQRFLRMQQVVETATVEFSKAKQTWCLDMCLNVQQAMQDIARRRQVQEGMVVAALLHEEEQLREELVALEEWAWRGLSRWNRFVEAVDAFGEKCLAAKISIVERLAGPGLPPPSTVLQSRLPRLKSVLQRSASMAMVVNRTANSASPQTSMYDADTPSNTHLSVSTSRSFRASDLDRRGSLFDLQPTRSMAMGVSPNNSMSFRRSPALASFVDEDMQGALDKLHTLPVPLAQLADMCLNNDPALGTLDVSEFHQSLTAEHVAILAAVCSQNTNLASVSFSGVAISDTWVESVARISNRVGSVDLTNTGLTDALLSALCDKWCVAEYGSNLRSVVLDDNAGLTAIAVSHVARVARMSHAVLDTASLKRVAGITPIHLKWLAFYLDLNKQHRQFKSVLLAVEARQVIPRLNFCIPRSKASSVNLKSIDALYRREFDDRSVRLLCIAVSNNTSVESISFRGNRITDKGAKLLATLLQKNRSIRELDLSYNEITNEGASVLENVLATGGNTSLMHLDLSENKGINDVALMQRMSQRLKRNIDAAS